MKTRLAVMMLLFIGLALMGTAVGAVSTTSATVSFTPVTYSLPTIPEQRLLPEASSLLKRSADDQNLNGSQNVELIGQIGGALNTVAVQGIYAYVGVGTNLAIVDVSNPAQPEKMSQVSLPGSFIGSVAIVGDYAYIANGNAGFWVIDVSNPFFPSEIGVFDTPGIASSAAVAGDFAYVTDSDAGLRVIDVSNPYAPSETSVFDTPGIASDVTIAGDYAYVADGDTGLRVIDVSNPGAPTETGILDTPGSAKGVIVVGNYAYIADGIAGLRIINVGNPSFPIEIGVFDTSITLDVTVVGSYAYITSGYQGSNSGLWVIDVSNPSSPTQVSVSNVPGFASGVAVVGGYAYIADSFTGLRLIDVSNPFIPNEIGVFSTIGFAEGVTTVGGYAYVASYWAGLRLIDVINPATPSEVGVPVTSYANDVTVVGGFAYVTAGSTGLQVVDINNPAAPSNMGTFDTLGFANGVEVVGSYAYVADGYAGLRVINVSNPTILTEIGAFYTPDYAAGVAVEGDYAYIANRVAGLRVIDVNNPSAPIEVGSLDTPDYAEDVAVSGGYAYVADGYAGLRVIDISDPTNPTEVGFLDTPDWAGDVVVVGRYAYVADRYAGLRVIDVSNPTTPTEVGFYDTSDWAHGVAVAEGYIYIADRYDGLNILRYDPCGNMNDSDGDGIPHGWEVCGYDYNHDGDYNDSTDVNLPAMGANPNIKDIFVEIDYMVEYDDTGRIIHTHQPKRDAIDSVVQAFAQKGIHLHVDWGNLAKLTWGDALIWGSLSDGEKLAHQQEVQQSGQWDWSGFDMIKNDQGHFRAERRPIFHYVIFAHSLGGGWGPRVSGVSRNISDLCPDIRSGASDLVVSLGEWRYGGTDVEQAGTLMHELGHNLGLCHGGDDDIEFKPNYLSVMNYSFQTNGLIKDGKDGYIDYSNFGNNIVPPLVETSLNESTGLNGGIAIDEYGTRWYCRYLGHWWDRRDPNANSALDWNCNLVPIGVVEANINDGHENNPNPTLNTLFAYNDWANLVFDGGLIGNTSPALNIESYFTLKQQGDLVEELTFDTAQTFYRPYAIAINSSNFGVVSPGINTTIPVTLTNTGALTATVTFNYTTSNWFDLSSIPVTVTLIPSATLAYEISLNIPGSATTGDEQEITINAILNESLLMGDSMALHARVGPMARFEAEPVAGITPHSISFTDLSIGQVNSWSWSFGDGFISNQQNPTHTYTTPGIYTVSLTVTGPDGVDTYTRTDLVRAQPHLAYMPVIQK